MGDGAVSYLVVVLIDPADSGRLLAIVRLDTRDHSWAWRTRPEIEQESARVGVVPGSVAVRVLDELPMPDGRSVE